MKAWASHFMILVTKWSSKRTIAYSSGARCLWWISSKNMKDAYYSVSILPSSIRQLSSWTSSWASSSIPRINTNSLHRHLIIYLATSTPAPLPSFKSIYYSKPSQTWRRIQWSYIVINSTSETSWSEHSPSCSRRRKRPSPYGTSSTSYTLKGCNRIRRREPTKWQRRWSCSPRVSQRKSAR